MDHDLAFSSGITKRLASEVGYLKGNVSEKYVSAVDDIRSKRIKWLVQEHHSELTRFCLQRDREKAELKQNFKLDLDRIVTLRTDTETRNKTKESLEKNLLKKLDLFDLHMKGQRKKLVAMQIDIMKKERENMDQLKENGRGRGLEELIEKFPYPKSRFILASFKQADDDSGDSNLLSGQKQDSMITLGSIESYDLCRSPNGISENLLPLSVTSLVNNLIPSTVLNECEKDISRKTLQENILNEHAEHMDTETSTSNFSSVEQVQPVMHDGLPNENSATSSRVSVGEMDILIEIPFSQSKNTNSKGGRLVEMQFSQGISGQKMQEKTCLDIDPNFNSHVEIDEVSMGSTIPASQSTIKNSDDISLAGNINSQRPVHVEFEKHGNSDLNAENEPSTAKSFASVGAYDGNILGEENTLACNDLTIAPNREEVEGGILMETEPIMATSDKELNDLIMNSEQPDVENELATENSSERAYDVNQAIPLTGHNASAREIPAVLLNQEAEEISTGYEVMTTMFGASQKHVTEDSGKSATLSDRTGQFQSSEQGKSSVETDGVCLTPFLYQNPVSAHALASPDFSNSVSVEVNSIPYGGESAPNGEEAPLIYSAMNNISSTRHGCEVQAIESVNVLSSSVVRATGVSVIEEAPHLHHNLYDVLLSDFDCSNTIQHEGSKQHNGGQPRPAKQPRIPMQQIQHATAVQAQPHLPVSQSFTSSQVSQPNILPERLNSENLSRSSMPQISARSSAPRFLIPQFKPLEYELLRILNKEKLCAQLHESKMQLLRIEQEKEVADIKKKYEDLIQTCDNDLSRDKEMFKMLTKKVNMQKDLATKVRIGFFKNMTELMETSQDTIGHIPHPPPAQMPDATLQSQCGGRNTLSSVGTQSLPLPLVNISASTSTASLKSSNAALNQLPSFFTHYHPPISTCENQSTAHARPPFPRPVTCQTPMSGITVQLPHSFALPDFRFTAGSTESQHSRVEPASLLKDPVAPAAAMVICLSDEE